MAMALIKIELRLLPYPGILIDCQYPRALYLLP